MKLIDKFTVMDNEGPKGVVKFVKPDGTIRFTGPNMIVNSGRAAIGGLIAEHLVDGDSTDGYKLNKYYFIKYNGTDIVTSAEDTLDDYIGSASTAYQGTLEGEYSASERSITFEIVLSGNLGSESLSSIILVLTNANGDEILFSRYTFDVIPVGPGFSDTIEYKVLF